MSEFQYFLLGVVLLFIAGALAFWAFTHYGKTHDPFSVDLDEEQDAKPARAAPLHALQPEDFRPMTSAEWARFNLGKSARLDDPAFNAPLGSANAGAMPRIDEPVVDVQASLDRIAAEEAAKPGVDVQTDEAGHVKTIHLGAAHREANPPI